MNPFEYKAVLFDLDGVLIDSEQKYTEIWNEIDRRYPTGVDNFAIKIKGTTLSDILDRYFADHRDEVNDLLHRLERELRYGWCDGAETLLKLLKGHRIKLALVTSSDMVKMRHLYEQLPSLQHWFDAILTAEDMTRSKPDPQGYLLAAERLGTDPSECLVVEDSCQGVMAGRSAGCRVLGISTTVGREAVEDAGADTVIDSLTEVLP